MGECVVVEGPGTLRRVRLRGNFVVVTRNAGLLLRGPSAPTLVDSFFAFQARVLWAKTAARAPAAR
jgi:hypothetical protein